MNEKPHRSATNLYKQILYSLLKLILFSFEDKSTITAVEAVYLYQKMPSCVYMHLSAHAYPHAANKGDFKT